MLVLVNPAKLGYLWIVLPVKTAEFAILENMQGTINPRSGTLVLFCPWIYASFPTQKIYTVGLHLKGNKVPFEMMAQDYMGHP